MFPGAYGNERVDYGGVSIIRTKILMQKFCMGTNDGCGFLFECQSALYSSFVGYTFSIQQLALIFADYLLQCCVVVRFRDMLCIAVYQHGMYLMQVMDSIASFH